MPHTHRRILAPHSERKLFWGNSFNWKSDKQWEHIMNLIFNSADTESEIDFLNVLRLDYKDDEVISTFSSD